MLQWAHGKKQQNYNIGILSCNMNPTAFIELLNEKDPSGFKDYKQLDRLLKEHPYFQIGLAAKSKYLKAKQHIDFIKTSRKTAIIFPNRPKLHYYLNQAVNTLTKPTEKVSEPIDGLTKETDLPLNQPETNPKESPESPTAPDINAPIPELEKNYLAEAINQSIQIEASGYTTEEFKNKPETQKEEKEILTFSDWLGGKPKYADKKNQDRLIDNFISEDPIITQVSKKDFYSPAEKGKESISDSNIPVSETLAQVFAQQGNKTLAIKCYEELVLICHKVKMPLLSF